MTAAYSLDETPGLVNRRMNGLGQGLRFATVVAHAFSGIFRWFEGFAVVAVDKMGTTFKSQAIWFRGASEDLLRVDSGLESEALVEMLKTQQQAIEKVKVDVLEVRKSLLDFQKMSTGKRLKASLSRSVANSSDLFDALESYRWTLLELEANRAEIRQGYLATSAADLDAMFDRLTACE